METREAGNFAEVVEAESLEQGVERGFERLAAAERAEGAGALAEAFDELTKVLTHELCQTAEKTQELCAELRGTLQEFTPEPGSWAEKVVELADTALHALERGADWLRTHPEAAECAVRIGLLALLVSTNPELANVLVSNPDQLARYIDVGPLLDAGLAALERGE